MRSLGSGLVLLVAIVIIGGCAFRPHPVDAGEEGVIVRKPFFFGSDGVDPTPASTGRVWLWFSSDLVNYDIRPVQFPEQFADLVTLDNVPIHLSAYMLVQLQAGKTPLLHERFGPQWYQNKVQEVFRTAVRDFARAHPLFDLTTNPQVTSEGERSIAQFMRGYLGAENVPVTLNKVVIGRATPPGEVLAETARTAAQEQRIKTESARARAELSRREAELNKAVADRAYAERFGMTADQYLRYRSLEIQKEMVEVVKDKQNVHVVVGADSPVPMFQVK